MLPRPCLHGRAPGVARSVRGGSWNNNQDNARADNRNNNNGFRRVFVSHIRIDCPLPPDSADYGLRDAGVGLHKRIKTLIGFYKSQSICGFVLNFNYPV